MAKNKETRVCRYPHCKHNDRIIDLNVDKYIKDGGAYLHEDCYKNKSDIQLIKSLWQEHISPTVVNSQLMSILNKLIFDNNISTDYILFVMQYCIDHKCRLQYPPGLRYYVDSPEIKEAYKKKTQPIIRQSEFTIDEIEDDSPKFNINKKPSGFKSILGGR